MQRMRTQPSDAPSTLKCPVAKRGGFPIERHTCRFLAAITMILAAANELSEPVVDTQHATCEREPVSLDTIVQTLREEFPSIRVVTTGRGEYGPPDYTSVGSESITSIRDRIYNSDVFTSFVQRMSEAVSFSQSAKIDDEQDEQGVVEYLGSYRLSRMEASAVPTTALDCNDFAQCACEALHAKGILSYMVSTWAQDPNDGFENWHIFTVCKINDNIFVIVDNGGVATIWHGTFASFLKQYRTKSPEESPSVRLVPFGISPFTVPKHDIGLGICKILTQVRTAVPHEGYMESVGGHEDTLLTSSGHRSH